MRYLELNEQNILAAAETLKAGKLVAFPTETVYGLGCDAFNTAALAKVFEAKKRPRFDPLIIHIASLDTLEKLVDFSRLAADGRHMLEVLSRSLWPGPLTLVMPKLKTVPDLATAGLETAAVRFPAHEGACRLIAEATGAIAAPSANPFGYLSPTRAEHVRERLGGAVDIILDGGPADIGVESTVLDISGATPRVLRPGGVPRETIETLVGPLAAAGGKRETNGTAPSPGLQKSHYATRKKLFLYAADSMRRLSFFVADAYLFFDKQSFKAFAERNGLCGADCERVFTLSEEGDANEAAARLFDA
ncbi:MAG: threonylcarbamoyl-AMP synthase, partial [Spirochaetaceae bacterium]|nr:threonylcarbamoyl-AMP synthase [Spirochaetaceae bacterium]